MHDWQKAAVQHAEAETPKESCGLLVMLDGAEHYWPCKNLSDEDDEFILDPMATRLPRTPKVLAVVHSHPGASAIVADVTSKLAQYGCRGTLW